MSVIMRYRPSLLLYAFRPALLGHANGLIMFNVTTIFATRWKRQITLMYPTDRLSQRGYNYVPLLTYPLLKILVNDKAFFDLGLNYNSLDNHCTKYLSYHSLKDKIYNKPA